MDDISSFVNAQLYKVIYRSTGVCKSKVKVKVNFTLEQATKAQSRGRNLLLTSALDEWESTPLPGRFTPGKEPVPLV